MGISQVRVFQILAGRAPISPETAVRLAHATGTDADYWLTLQRQYDLHRAKVRLAPKLGSLPRLSDVP
jgi:addiction module HigA family antidote